MWLMLLLVIGAHIGHPVQILTCARDLEPFVLMVKVPLVVLPLLLLLMLIHEVDVLMQGRHPASTSKVHSYAIVEDDLRLVVAQGVETTIVDEVMLSVDHHSSLRPSSTYLILSGWLRCALGTRDAALVLALIPQAIDLNYDALFTAHGRFILARRDRSGAQGLLRTIIRVMTLLLAVEALDALVPGHVLRVETNDLVHLLLRLFLLLAVGRLVAKLAAMVANDRVIVPWCSRIVLRESPEERV